MDKPIYPLITIENKIQITTCLHDKLHYREKNCGRSTLNSSNKLKHGRKTNSQRWKSMTISQWMVWGKRSTAIDLTGWKCWELGMDLVLCLARPALLILRHPLFPLFFSGLSVVGVQSSIAFATKESGLQEIYLYKKKNVWFFKTWPLQDGKKKLQVDFQKN